MISRDEVRNHMLKKIEEIDHSIGSAHFDNRGISGFRFLALNSKKDVIIDLMREMGLRCAHGNVVCSLCKGMQINGDITNAMNRYGAVKQ